MSYSLDLRRRVVEFVKSGGSKAEAHRRFKISLWCVFDWCKRDDLIPKLPPGRPRKLDWEALKKDFINNPDKLLRERAKEFGVHINAIWHASQVMNITYKKNTEVQRKKS